MTDRTKRLAATRAPQALPVGGADRLTLDCDGGIMGPTHRARRLELDRELDAIGAHRIEVRDLGAAMVASHFGTIAVSNATRYHDPATGAQTWAVFAYADHAAHYARRALGLTEGS